MNAHPLHATRRRLASPLLGLCLLLNSSTASVSAAQEPQSARPPTGDQHLTHVLRETGQTIPFRLYVPTTYDGTKPLPLIVALHGGGVDENDVFDRNGIQALAESHHVIVVAPRGYDSFGGYGDFLPIVTTPRAAARAARAIAPASVDAATAFGAHGREPGAPGDPKTATRTSGISAPALEELDPAGPDEYLELASSKLIDGRVVDLSEKDVLEVMEWVEAHYRVARDRVYLTGNSMGGIGTEYLAVKYPKLWAAAAPAGCPTPIWSYPFDRLKQENVALLFVHGELDNLSNPRWSRELAEAAAARGIEARFLMIPGASHASGWNRALPQIFDFLLAHRRAAS